MSFCRLQRRKLDAVYFYMRSLAASNPFLTARESLMSLFDEARKKVREIPQIDFGTKLTENTSSIRAGDTTGTASGMKVFWICHWAMHLWSGFPVKGQ